MKDKKLIKVIFEYGDGSKKILEGEELVKWENEMNSALVLKWSHGF